MLSSLTANVCSRLLSSLVFLFSNLGCSRRSENISNAKQRPGLPCLRPCFFNPYRADQKVLLLPETDTASTNPTLIFHVLTFDFLLFWGGDDGGQLNLPAVLLFDTFCPAMLSTQLVTNCVLRLLVSVPADGPHPHPTPAHLLCTAVMFPLAPWTHGLYFWVLFFLLLQQTTSGHKDGPCDLMDHFIYLVFLPGMTHVWQAAGGMSAWLLLSVLHVFMTITSKHNMHFVCRKWSWSPSD